jgi:hypothetical protein
LDCHGVELASLDRLSKQVKKAKAKYSCHPLQVKICFLLLALFISAAAFLITTLFIGLLNANAILAEKPFIIGSSGYRRALSQGIVLWQREYYINQIDNPLKQQNLIKEF